MKPTLLRTAVVLAISGGLPVLAQSPAPAPNQPSPATPLTPPPASTAPGAPAATTAPVPGAPKPFKDIVKDAKESKGFFDVWQKDDKVWIAVKPEQIDKPFYLSVIRTHGLGERMVIGG